MLTAIQLARRLNELESRMFKHAQNLEFEQAAQCRDEMDQAEATGAFALSICHVRTGLSYNHHPGFGRLAQR